MHEWEVQMNEGRIEQGAKSNAEWEWVRNELMHKMLTNELMYSKRHFDDLHVRTWLVNKAIRDEAKTRETLQDLHNGE